MPGGLNNISGWSLNSKHDDDDNDDDDDDDDDGLSTVFGWISMGPESAVTQLMSLESN